LLISEPVEVEMCGGPSELQEPEAFAWRGERYEVAQVLSAWTEVGFGAGERTRTWYRRRHRNHWRVRTADGGVYELYMDRSGSRRSWVLARKLSG
jgi:hypothetical protein